ncbi:MAG: HAMP domain-containing protein [Proteobacteria bacterium]|nr:HAMP domain-containing protein [Pseudomonadota bacterium]
MRTLRSRIVAAFVAALLPAILALLFLVGSQRSVHAALNVVTEAYLPLSRVAAQLERDRDRMHNEVGFLLGEDRVMRRGATPSFSAAQLRETLVLAKTHVAETEGELPASERAVFGLIAKNLRNIDALLHDYEAKTLDLIAARQAGTMPTERELAFVERRNRGVSEETRRVTRLVDESIARITRSAEEAQSRATTIAVTASTLSAVFALLLVTAVIVQLRPIGELTQQVQRVAAGEPGVGVEVAGSDEVAALAHEFNAMVRALEARDTALVDRAEELRRLNGYLESVLHSLDDGLMVVEAGRVTLSNPAATSRWGAHSARPAPPPLDGLITRPGRHEVTGAAGTLHEVRVTSFGETGVVVVTSDVTDATESKERLARSERLALVGQMLAQITHEVRNPLNAMSLNAELLMDEIQDLDPTKKTEALEMLGTISSEIDRLTDVTGHYLQLARRPPARLEPENLPALLEDVVRILDAELAQHGIAVALDASGVGVQRIDGNQLRQALMNIVRNATEAGARHLRVQATRANREVRIAIADDGPGMSDEEHSRAFDPFFSTKASGTGLGLAITKQILEDHDGTVHVASSDDGSTVTLVLPDRPGQPVTPTTESAG